MIAYLAIGISVLSIVVSILSLVLSRTTERKLKAIMDENHRKNLEAIHVRPRPGFPHTYGR